MMDTECKATGGRTASILPATMFRIVPPLMALP
jgi:hypothetical protein